MLLKFRFHCSSRRCGYQKLKNEVVFGQNYCGATVSYSSPKCRILVERYRQMGGAQKKNSRYVRFSKKLSISCFPSHLHLYFESRLTRSWALVLSKETDSLRGILTFVLYNRVIFTSLISYCSRLPVLKNVGGPREK
jgi:hypothetical protein